MKAHGQTVGFLFARTQSSSSTLTFDKDAQTHSVPLFRKLLPQSLRGDPVQSLREAARDQLACRLARVGEGFREVEYRTDLAIYGESDRRARVQMSRSVSRSDALL